MSKKEVIIQTADYVKKTLKGDGSGHDWWHIYRVWQNAKLIGKKENVDMFIVELGALLHDIADFKFHNGDLTAGPKKARKWLTKINLSSEIIDQVCHIVENVSFKGANVKNLMQTKEGKVVQDADRLDALGAIGIARVFAFGGNKGRSLYNPDEKPVLHNTFDDYKKSNASSINHFYEKLFLLKNLMYTETAKKIASKRHDYMKKYLDRFFAEWDGKM